MARQTLASKLRERAGAIIRRRTDALKRELRSLGDDYKEVGRIAIYGKKKAKRKTARRKTARGKTARRSPASGSARPAKKSARAKAPHAPPRKAARAGRR